MSIQSSSTLSHTRVECPPLLLHLCRTLVSNTHSIRVSSIAYSCRISTASVTDVWRMYITSCLLLKGTRQTFYVVIVPFRVPTARLFLTPGRGVRRKKKKKVTATHVAGHTGYMHTQKLSPDRLRRLVAALADSANVSASARRIGVSRWLVYKWYNESRDNDELEQYLVEIAEGEFLPLYEAWDSALEVATDHLEAVAARLATGYEEPLTHQGQITMVYDEFLDKEVPVTITKYSERMLEILLKARRPEKYRERHDHKHSGEVGGVLMVPAPVTDKKSKGAWEEAADAQQAEARKRQETADEEALEGG